MSRSLLFVLTFAVAAAAWVALARALRRPAGPSDDDGAPREDA